MVTKSKADPDTGLTPAEVKNFWKDKPTAEQLGMTGPSTKPAKTKPARKLARKSDTDVGTNDLKTQAVNLYGQGLSAKDVAKALSITYANAYYYKRFVGADVAKARLDQALTRV